MPAVSRRLDLHRDYPTIQAFALFMGSVFVLLNLVVDLSYVWLDPRVRIGTGRAGRP